MNAGFPILTFMTVLPLLGALVVALLPARRIALARGLALLTSLATLVLAIGLWVKFDPLLKGMQFVEQHDWIPTLKVQYFLGIDGLGVLMVLLAALVVPFAMLALWRIEQNTKFLFALFLTLQAGMFGAFTALNFFHWFLFWELSLVPAYFLIKLWGGPQRVQAATQFFVYTFFGSIIMLIGFAALWPATETFSFVELAEAGPSLEALLKAYYIGELGWNIAPQTLAMLVFAAVLLGFAVKVPLMPFHTWLPNTYAEAPFGVTMVLTGVMSKMGVYGFIRILLPVFPAQMHGASTLLMWLAVITIVASALAAFAQRDLKRLFAYSSINHLGYCLLGIFAVTALGNAGADAKWATEKAAALNGVLLQMFNHGITAAALFFFIGLIEQRTGLRGIDDFGGLRKAAPVFCGLMGITVFASLGLPGLSGFVGEFLIFKGSFALAQWATILAAPGLLVTAVFLLTLMQKVFHGPLNSKWTDFNDLTLSERIILAPAVLLIFVLGIYPQAVIGVINSTVMQMVEQIKI